MMTSPIPCIIVLACTVILSSSETITRCTCINSGTGVRVPVNRIVTAKEYAPRPYCNKKEVIVTVISGRKVCLDPEEESTKEVLQKVTARDAAKNTTTSKTTTKTESRCSRRRQRQRQRC